MKRYRNIRSGIEVWNSEDRNADLYIVPDSKGLFLQIRDNFIKETENSINSNCIHCIKRLIWGENFVSKKP